MASPLLHPASRLPPTAERIAKQHALIGRGILAARSRRGMNESFAEFEKELRRLTAAALPQELRDNYRLLRLLWDEYRAAAAQAPNADGARKLAERAEEVVWIAEKGARLLHESARTGTGERVLAAGAAAAAAQRLARMHLHRGWALPAGGVQRELKAAESAIPLAMTRLKADSTAIEEIAMALRIAEDQFTLMRQSIERQHLEHMAKAADHVAESLDRVGALYAARASEPGS